MLILLTSNSQKEGQETAIRVVILSQTKTQYTKLDRYKNAINFAGETNTCGH